MRTLIDANVILRYILNDNEDMAEKAREVIESDAEVYPEVVAETVYVLKSVYNIPREEIADILVLFLESVYMQDKTVTLYALGLFGKENLDFVDCMLIARNYVENRNVFSFDKKLNSRLKQL